MMENIFTKKYAEALVAEDPLEGNKPVGMAIVSNLHPLELFAAPDTKPAQLLRDPLHLRLVLLLILYVDM